MSQRRNLLPKPHPVHGARSRTSGRALLLVAALVLAATGPSTAAPRTLTLRESAIEVCIDREPGTLLGIANLLTGDRHDVLADQIRIDTSTDPVTLPGLEIALVEKGRRSVSFRGRSSGLEVTVSYEIGRGRAYFERRIRLRNVTKRAIVLHRVTGCSLRFAEPFLSAVFHDDNMDRNDPLSYTYMERDAPVEYGTSVNVFLRNRRGGLVAGLKYPYFTHEMANDSLTLSYEANYCLAAGDALELPAMFCGVYRKAGYAVRKELSWTPRILSSAQEEMDLGEVQAMQKVMRDHLPRVPCPAPGYFIWLNSYWVYDRTLGGEGMTKLDAARAASYNGLADLVKKSRCIDLMGLAHVWCGWAQYLEPCSEIDTVGEGAAFPLNANIESVTDHARDIGLPISSFCEPTALVRHYRSDRPDWRVRPDPDAPGTLIQPCHANPAYEGWFRRLICGAIDSCSLSGWAFDHQWVRKPLTCHGATHGHEPGNCEFGQYLNVTRLIAGLRERYPALFLEAYWGLKEAGPWALRGLNSMENAYENGAPAPPGFTAADDLRFQHWFNHNYRFIPTYLNMAQINFGREDNGHRYSLLSCLSASTHASVCDWKPFSTQAGADAVFGEMRRWKKWASDHLAYLEDRVDLFGMPCRTGGIDGTAHMLGDRGFIFAFNPTRSPCAGSVPLGDLIGLTRGTRYSVDEISSGRARRLGVFRRGDSMLFGILAKTALLFEIQPSKAPLSQTGMPAGVEAQPAFRP